MMKQFIRYFFRNLTAIFHWKNLPWHILAIGLTYLIVITGFDWLYFEFTRFIPVWAWIPAGAVGAFIPVLLPIGLLLYGRATSNTSKIFLGQALAQAAILGSLVSSSYKFFTGRTPPDLFNTLTDISNSFRFGFGEGGVFWGWPSSHTTIAFAMATTLIALYPNNKNLKVGVLVYALYIGLGASIGFHWFSEFAAGIVFGTLIGWVVGNNFKRNN